MKSEKTMIDEADTAPDGKLGKTRYHHGDLRAGLIEATRRLVEEKGPEGFSVTDACRLAGVSTAAPYKHFKDKNDMLVSMILEGVERQRERMQAALEGIPKGTTARVTAMGREYVNFALSETGVFSMKFGGFAEGLDDDRLEAAGEENYGLLLAEVAACLGETEVTEEVRRRALMLWSFVHGLSFLMIDQKVSSIVTDDDLQALLSDAAERVLKD